MASLSFDHTCMGSEIVLSRRRRTAKRRHARSEFCNAIVLTSEPLLEVELFEVRLDETHPGWGSSLVIGVTDLHPDDDLAGILPSSACDLRKRTVLIRGSSILVDGVVTDENFCENLDSLEQGARVGVALVFGQLHLYINGKDLGVVPTPDLCGSPLRGVIDLHGCCVQVSLSDPAASMSEGSAARSLPLLFSRCPGSSISLDFERRAADFEPSAAGNDDESPLSSLAFGSRPLNENEIFEIQVTFPRLSSCSVNSGRIEIDVTGRLSTETQPFLDGDGLLSANGVAPDQATRSSGDRLGVVLVNGEVGLMRNGELGRWEACGSSENIYPVVRFRDDVSQAYISGTSGMLLPEYDAVRSASASTSASVSAPTSAAASATSSASACTTASALTPLEVTAETIAATEAVAIAAGLPPPLRFHRRCGRYTHLCNGSRTAYRTAPDAEFNYAIAAGERCLVAGEVFEVSVDERVAKWTGGMELGVMIMNPDTMHMPSTMTDITIGTWLLCRNGVVYGGVTEHEDLGLRMGALAVGDRVAVLLTKRRCLRFAINGVDLGVEIPSMPEDIYPVVDVYGQTSQVSICDPPSPALTLLANSNPRPAAATASDDSSPLCFSSLCGMNAVVDASGRKASRDGSVYEFNNAVCITNRKLKPDEYLEIVVEKTVSIWSGSLEIGVTLTSPTDMDFPETISDLTRDSWTLSMSGVFFNGHNIFPGYPLNLSRLDKGSLVGMVVRANGDLHFTLDGIDYGCAANVPLGVYGLIDLYGQCTEVSLNESPVLPPLGVRPVAAASCVHSDDDDDLSASDTSDCDSDCIDSDDSTVSAALRTGSYNPLHFPGESESMSQSRAAFRRTTSHNVLHDLQVAVRESMHQLANTVTNTTTSIRQNFALSLNAAAQRAGEDQSNSSDEAATATTSAANVDKSTAKPADSLLHAFHPVCGRNVTVAEGGRSATRTHGFDHGIVFSGAPLQSEEIFEVRVDESSDNWCGNIGIGVVWSVPSAAAGLTSSAVKLPSEMCGGVWLLSGASLYHDGVAMNSNFAGEMERLKKGDVIGVQRCLDASLKFYLNKKDLGVAVCQVPSGVYAVIDVYGKTRAVSVVSRSASDADLKSSSGTTLQNTDLSSTGGTGLRFHSVCGRNVSLDSQRLVACREKGFNHALVFSSRPLKNGEKFEFRVEKLSERWSGSPLVGVTQQSPVDLHGTATGGLPASSHGLSSGTWLMNRVGIFVNGVKVRNQFDVLHDGKTPVQWNVGDTFGILHRDEQLFALYNGRELATSCPGIAKNCYALLDLYGPVTEAKLLVSPGGLVADGDDVLESSRSRSSSGSSSAIGTVLEMARESPSNPAASDSTTASSSSSSPSSSSSAVPTTTCSTGTEPDVSVVSVTLPRSPACPTAQSPPAMCTARQNATLFKASLGLPDAFFNPEFDSCFCEQCFPFARGVKAQYRSAGDPAAYHSIPKGWTVFALRLHPRAVEVHQIFKKWHVAYHGTAPGAVRKILDTGFLLQPGDFAIGGVQLREADGHYNAFRKPAGFDTRKVFVSPSMAYAGDHAYSRPTTFRFAKKQYSCQVAFKVFVRPGSYSRGASTLGIGQHNKYDSYIEASEIEWSTKERGVVELCGLLVKVTPLAERQIGGVITVN